MGKSHGWYYLLYSESGNSNIEKIKLILRIIGSPYRHPEKVELSENQIKELYKIAVKNKIGLLFLESIEKTNQIANLVDEIEKQRSLYELQRGTFVRTISSINKVNCNYAVIKTIFPFPAVPNDIDILILDNDMAYRKVVDELKKNNFLILGQASLEVNLRDMTTAKSADPEAKQWEDIDIYKEVGASHLIYMDKTKLRNHTIKKNVNGQEITILDEPSELAISIFHALYPERIYTLLLHHNILFKLKEMKRKDMKLFLDICEEQKIKNATLATLRITESIEEICFGESPNELMELRDLFGKKERLEIKKVPYIYPLHVMLSSFWEKKSEKRFISSFVRQAFSFFNPKTADFVIKQYKERAERDTY